MEKVKIFWGGTQQVEKEINTWLEVQKDKISITRATQSSPGNGLCITIFYQERTGEAPFR